MRGSRALLGLPGVALYDLLMTESDTPRKSLLAGAKDAAVPKKEDGSVSWKRVTTLWGKVTFVLAVLGTVGGAFTWVNDRLNTIERTSADVSTLKDSNAAILETQREQDQRITDQVNRATKMIRDEFAARDEVDRELRANIRAVLVEVRARHGIITTADVEGATTPVRARVRVQEAQEASDRATIRSGNALPQSDPLAGLRGL